ncbi:MAG: metalloregulator ArsR/SmtB family transcription factor [Parvularculaceae bacterium]
MELLDASSAFSALAEPTRLETVKFLTKAGPRGVSAGEIAELTGAAAPTMSFHLKELAHNGLIQSRKEGRRVIYAVNYGGLRSLIDFLMDDVLAGDPRLCGPYIVAAK